MKQLNRSGQIAGSALIMAVVLTVLLSMVGMMFIMVARMDKASTSSIIENKELQSAVDSVVEIISQQLVLDSPGVAGKEYYDYPGNEDEWLASIEPYDTEQILDGQKVYKWRQISDITGFLHDNSYGYSDVDVQPHNVAYNPDVIKEYPAIKVDSDGFPEDQSADADGDGIADSKWIELEDMRTSKGQKIYAAVRVIDNSAMLNVNTAYKFAPNNDPPSEQIDGSTQAQINLAGLMKDSNDSNGIIALHNARSDANQSPWSDNFRNYTIWNFGIPHPNYPQFDVSDELEMRYRYCIDGRTKARVEAKMSDDTLYRGGTFTDDYGLLYNGSSDWGLGDWKERIPNHDRVDLDRRHLLTTCNLDRIIDPNGYKMFSAKIIDCNAQTLYNRLKSSCIDPNLSVSDKDDKAAQLAQICTNIIDYSDGDANVSVVIDHRKDDEHYGFERPFIYISEIVRNFQKSSSDPCDPNVYMSYAVELYKNFSSDEKFDDWELKIGSDTIPIRDEYFEKRGGNYYVIIYENANASLADRVKFSDSPNDEATGVDPNYAVLDWEQTWFGEIPDPCDPNKTIDILSDSYDVYFGTNWSDVKNATTSIPMGVLKHEDYAGYSYAPAMDPNITYYWRVDAWRNKGDDPNDPCDFDRERYDEGGIQSFTTWDEEPNSVKEWIEPNDIVLGDFDIVSLHRDVDVDGSTKSITVDSKTITNPEFSNTNVPGIRSYRRDIHWNNCLKRLWDPNATVESLGHSNGYNGSFIRPIQPFHSGFRTIGEVGKIFRKSTYIRPSNRFSYGTDGDFEKDVRIDLQDPYIQKIFQYITVMDPDRFYINGATETRVKGRLNINTAPKFLIQQLPWVSSDLAEAIVAYRDMTKIVSADTIDYNDRNVATGLNSTDYPLRDKTGFASTGELMTVINRDHETDFEKRKYSIQKYGFDNTNERGFPDISTDSRSKTDSAADDLEEKELIFARISDLVTVRSDVFTAYVLVRLGTDGPQKRIVTILDRSGVNSKDDQVRIRALQLTPDPR